MIYLDNAATTPMSAVAISAMTKVLQETHGNPSSIHGHGRQAGKLLREARQELSQLLGTKPQHIFFTSGGTEGNNTAIIGYCLRHQEQGKHIITTAIEHHAVLETIDYLVQHFGFEVNHYPARKSRNTPPSKFKRPYVTIRFWFLPCLPIMRLETYCLLLKLAKYLSNTLLPIMSMQFRLLEKSLFIQKNWAFDFLTASAHKFHGPKGIGFLYTSSMDFDSYIHGGDQEQKKRAGTENLAAIVGMV